MINFPASQPCCLLLQRLLIQLSRREEIIVPPFKMDPLSVIASVVGLIGAAGKVESVLLAVKTSILDAPRLMDHCYLK
jgi:hypothetical protein